MSHLNKSKEETIEKEPKSLAKAIAPLIKDYLGLISKATDYGVQADYLGEQLEESELKNTLEEIRKKYPEEFKHLDDASEDEWAMERLIESMFDKIVDLFNEAKEKAYREIQPICKRLFSLCLDRTIASALLTEAINENMTVEPWMPDAINNLLTTYGEGLKYLE